MVVGQYVLHRRLLGPVAGHSERRSSGAPRLGSVFKDHWVVDHGGVIRRDELTDQEWELLAPLIPRTFHGSATGDRPAGHQRVAYKIRTGISWRDLPERYGPWKTVYTRFRRYALEGVFTRALRQIQAQADAAGDIDWLVQIDSTIVRTHQHAAATGQGGATGRTNRTREPCRQFDEHVVLGTISQPTTDTATQALTQPARPLRSVPAPCHRLIINIHGHIVPDPLSTQPP
ncbi:transposase [Streptomyces sp. NPDC046832]|uniref:transposase n=1 Tax=Streptomyces sp. NPDC046832 TaxID=3155020 RepID=UPI00340D112A